MMRGLGLMLCAAAVSAVFVSAATAGGGSNAANAKKCQKNGWTTWVRADQTPFASEQACTSYAAKGGVLTAPNSAAQTTCESVGGTYVAGSGSNLWRCDGWPEGDPSTWQQRTDTLSDQCFADLGTRFGVHTTIRVLESDPVVWNSRCDVL